LTTDYKKLANQIKQLIADSTITDPFIADSVITDQALCYTYSVDASVYHLQPKIVVKVSNKRLLKKVMTLCHQFNAPYTFRTAGTSLSGQAQSDSVLIMLEQGWQAHQVFNCGEQIECGIGLVGARVNQILQPYNRKIGPDPASINHCKIGGIAANNASGMCCGTAQNSYQTLANIKLILADGTELDTANKDSIEQFKQSQQPLIDGISELTEQCQNDEQLKHLIQQKYRLKNTMGYSLNALLDFTDPVDIIAHLMIGSEGTLGFIESITYNTVAVAATKATSLIIYPTIDAACLVVSQLKSIESNLAAVELIDGLALASLSKSNITYSANIESSIKSILELSQDNKHCCALLVETEAASQSILDQQISSIEQVLTSQQPLFNINFSQDSQTQQQLWQLRKGLFPSVAAGRAQGTSVVIEDIAFDVSQLAEATVALKALLVKYGYSNAIIFGHALQGNLHFVFSQDFNQSDELKRYQQMMQALSELVIGRYQGSLKAEHGTGRNMAPFVEIEWGAKAYQIMQQIKQLFDPKALLNPGVIINPDKNVHLKHLKQIPSVRAPEYTKFAKNLVTPENSITGENSNHSQNADLPIEKWPIDNCMECGFCEQICPSKNLSLTPRQRIVMLRQIKQLQLEGKVTAAKKLSRQFDYLGDKTCATTGLCATACPVGINTGDIVLSLRQQNNQKYFWLAHRAAQSFGLLCKISQFLFGLKLKSSLKIKSFNKPQHKQKLQELPSLNKVVYFSSCASRVFSKQNPLLTVTQSLIAKAGLRIIKPEQEDSLCCGLAFKSKGFNHQSETKSQQLEASLWQASEQGKWPILIDASPCQKQLIEQLKASASHLNLKTYEPVEFVLQHLSQSLQFKPLDETVMLHISCSSVAMGLTEQMVELAKRCANKVIIPEGISCCGFAGDKGFTTPELNQAALNSLAAQVPNSCSRGFSNSATCEIGLSQHSGIDYQSILVLVDDATSAV
jgi:D-lactate dehydrogenase